MLLLTNCETHTAKYLDPSFKAGTELSEICRKNYVPNIFLMERTIGE